MGTLQQIGYTLSDPRKVEPFERQEQALALERNRFLAALTLSLAAVGLIVDTTSAWTLGLSALVYISLIGFGYAVLRGRGHAIALAGSAVLAAGGMILFALRVSGMLADYEPMLVAALALVGRLAAVEGARVAVEPAVLAARDGAGAGRAAGDGAGDHAGAAAGATARGLARGVDAGAAAGRQVATVRDAAPARADLVAGADRAAGPAVEGIALRVGAALIAEALLARTGADALDAVLPARADVAAGPAVEGVARRVDAGAEGQAAEDKRCEQGPTVEDAGPHCHQEDGRSAAS